MEKPELAYCGLNCETCPVFIATANDDGDLRRRTAEEWSQTYAAYLGNRKLLPVEMVCSGCKSDGAHFVGCMNCPIKACNQGKGFATCASCSDYETCEMLKGFFTFLNHKSAKDNLDKLRSMR